MDTEENFELLRGICQIKNVFISILFLTLSVVSSCTRKVIVHEFRDTQPTWFNTAAEFSSFDADGYFSVHQFFDPISRIDLDKKMVEVVMTTNIGSASHYELDIASGKKYLSHNYCKEDDSWKSFKSSIEFPSYSEGFVPRLLNQIKKPQRVIVFGDEKYLPEPDSRRFSKLINVRVIGGVIEQFCPNYPCDVPTKWLSSIVLIAVNPGDKDFENVLSFKDLSMKVDWQYAKTFLENGRGRFVNDESSYPAYRIYGQVLPEKAINFAIEKGHLFSSEELQSLRNSCEILYRSINENRLLAAKGEVDFTKYIYNFHKNNLNQFYTCQDFVKTYDIVKDSQAHWFMEYLRAFTFLAKKELVYSCHQRAWLVNYRKENGRLAYDMDEELKTCSLKQVNEMFEKSIGYLSGLRKSTGEYLEYLEYDSGINSTSEKIYNWTKRSGKTQTCSKQRQRNNFFPSDIRWVPFVNKKEKESFKIIR